MTDPNDYIQDWTEQDGPEDGCYADPEVEGADEYSDQQELQDEERRYEEKEK